MAIHLSAPRTTELKPRIVVFGVGGAGDLIQLKIKSTAADSPIASTVPG